ncbi:MAG: glycoside hydrolase family 43 protein [Lachnospiraceae bacterium]|nr:glycoside hydrolase family 43 protein [Lachnospiraceae bacterium]
MKRKIHNPILPGFYPDPSICRVGEDFYMVCSSFELWPGIPIFHSRDMGHWEQIGNVMTGDNHFRVEKNCGNGGVMAPTIRYCNGLFYIINTNFSDRGNYIVTAEDPRGPWSEPHWLTDVPGIDASLFFDDDDQAYVIGTGDVWDNGAGKMERGFWLAKYDVQTFCMIGEPVTIFNSALREAASPEAPHIYHIGEYYYLIFAEGGTEHFHAVMAARSREIFGFYEGCPANPLLTHRHMGYTCPITNVGHADLVDLPDGSWCAVLLASRLIDGNHKNLGRETFYCPITWERGWPLFSPETGRLEWEYEAPACLQETPYPAEESFDGFSEAKLRPYWTLWGTPQPGLLRFDRPGVSLRCVEEALDADIRPMAMEHTEHDLCCAAFLARRQKSPDTVATCSVEFTPAGAETAGLAVVQAMNHQVRIELAQSNGNRVIRAVKVTADYDYPPYFPGFTSQSNRTTMAEVPWEKECAILQIQMDGQNWTIRYGDSPEELIELATVDGRDINPEKVGCMTGTMVGMFATGNGSESENYAHFHWYRQI